MSSGFFLGADIRSKNEVFFFFELYSGYKLPKSLPLGVDIPLMPIPLVVPYLVILREIS
jgi:hypothetical protein